MSLCIFQLCIPNSSGRLQEVLLPRKHNEQGAEVAQPCQQGGQEDERQAHDVVEEGGRVNADETAAEGCCYITVDSATSALQNGACTYRCIS
jgi:hypothetical protein